MSKTKVELVIKAYKWLRISGLTSQPDPEEISDGIDMLESMMLELSSRNICSSYFFEDEPLPNTDSRLEPKYNTAVETNLAVRLAPFFGKVVSVELALQARQSLSNWSARSAKVNQIRPPRRMPRGSGNTFRFSNWVRFSNEEPNAPISCDTREIKVDEINNFRADFNQYLVDPETISSFITDTTTGIELLSISESNGVFTFQCKGIKAGFEAVEITVTTSTGRVNPAVINFNVTQ